MTRRSYLVSTTMTGIFTSRKISENVEDRNAYQLTIFSELQQILVPGLQQSRSLTRCFNAKPMEKTFSKDIQLQMRKISPYHMYLIRKLCTTRGSISKEGLYDLEFLNISRFKAHTVMEDETWILVRVVPAADVGHSSTIMSDINGGLQSFQLWTKCSQEL